MIRYCYFFFSFSILIICFIVNMCFVTFNLYFFLSPMTLVCSLRPPPAPPPRTPPLRLPESRADLQNIYWKKCYMTVKSNHYKCKSIWDEMYVSKSVLRNLFWLKIKIIKRMQKSPWMLKRKPSFPRVKQLKLVIICFGIFRLLRTKWSSTSKADSVIHPSKADKLSTIYLIVPGFFEGKV